MKPLSLFGILLSALLLAGCGPTGQPITTSPVPEPTSTPTVTHLVSPAHPNAAIRFARISLEEGLSQSVVNCIVQDRQGFLWFGTQDGLNRYDGTHFKVYKPDPVDQTSLSSAWVTALYEDREGFMWVGTRQGGLNRYDPQSGKFTRYLHNPRDPASLSEGSVQAILQDSAGRLWVGTKTGLNRFDATSEKFEHYVNDPAKPTSLIHNNVLTLLESKKGELWIGTYNGLEVFVPTSNSFHSYTHDADNLNSLSDTVVTSLAEDAQGNIWIGTGHGLDRLDAVSGEFKVYLHDKENPDSLLDNWITSLRFDQRGRLWVGTNYGLERFDPASNSFSHYRHNPLVLASLSNDSVYALYEDREGLLWVGTWGGGVNKYNPAQDKFGYYRYDPYQPGSLSDGGVFGTYGESSGVAWIGSYGSGLNRFDPATGLFSNYPHDPQNSSSLNSPVVWAVYRDSQNTLWVGTSRGLDRFDEKSGIFIHHIPSEDDPDSLISMTVYAIYEDTRGQLWIGTDKGLDRLDRSTGKFIHTKAGVTAGDVPGAVGKMMEDSAGNLWVGSLSSGLYLLDAQRENFEHFENNPEDPTSLPNNFVLDIHQDTHGSLWVATAGGGLSKFDPAARNFKSYTERQGLANNSVYCIVEDEQSTLWLSTNYGISRFELTNESFRNYTVSDGLQSNEFNMGACGQTGDGAIYLGGVNGLTRFFPGDIQSSSYTPNVALTSLTLEGQPIQHGSTVETLDAVTLKWPQNSFEFQFAALSLAEPKRNQFAYRLENFENDWNILGNQQDGRYTNLPGGTYTLRLKASNADGVWNETGRAIRVIVVPPFWQTWWFYCLVALTAGGSVLGGYRLRVRSIEAQKLELQRQVSERTREIEELFEQTRELAIIEERNRLARDLHDSAKQKAFAALAQIGTAGGLFQNNARAAREHLSEAEDLVSDVIQELTFLIQEMYPLALKEKGLAASLREYAFEWEHRTDIPLNVKIEGERRLKLETEQAVYRIVQESLANIARHSHASQASLYVHYNNANTEVTVTDNGHGFDLGRSPNGIGLRLIRERAESAGGQISIQSEPGMGTRVSIIIPDQQA